MRGKKGFLCAAMLLVALDVGAACRPWVEVRTENFRAISDRPQEELLTIVDTLVRFEDFVTRITSSGKFEPSRPTLVVMLSRTEWDRYVPFSSRIGGLFRTGATENLILLPEPRLKPRRYSFPPPPPSLKRDEPNPYETILHEYVHFVMLDGTVRYPRWYTEGMAEVLAAVDFEGSRLRFGVLWEYELQAARQARSVSFADLIERFPRHDETPKQGVTNEAYALSKTLVHYLSFAAKERAGQVPQYLTLLNEGVAPESAFKSAFRTDYAGMQAELDEYLRRTAFPGGYMDWSALAGAADAKVREIPCDEAMVETGLALLSVNADGNEIRNGWFDRAKREVPGSIPADIGLAYLADAEEDFATADGILDAIDPSKTALRWRNWAASLYFYRRGNGSDATAAEQDAWIGRGVRWYPERDYPADPEAAHAYLQAAYFYFNSDEAEAVSLGAELARKAVAVRPKDYASARMAAGILQNRGESAAAIPYWQVVARYAPDPSTRQDAARQVRVLSRESSAPATP